MKTPEFILYLSRSNSTAISLQYIVKGLCCTARKHVEGKNLALHFAAY